jgi:hypothetical protein
VFLPCSKNTTITVAKIQIKINLELFLADFISAQAYFALSGHTNAKDKTMCISNLRPVASDL